MDATELEHRIEHANELHARNYNCAQCVALSCSDMVGLDERCAFGMLEGFGGGMGGGTQTCGALSGAIAIVSYRMSGGPHNPTTKKATYALVGPLVEEFTRRAGSTICNAIRGKDGGPVLHTCPDCIADGIRLALTALEELDARR